MASPYTLARVEQRLRRLQAVSPVPASIPSADVWQALAFECDAATKPNRALDKRIWRARCAQLGMPFQGGRIAPEYTKDVNWAYYLFPDKFGGMVNLREARLALDCCAAACRAQAIEARRAETQSGSVHESAVGETDAPSISSLSTPTTGEKR